MYNYGTVLQRPLTGKLGRLYKHVGIHMGRNRVIHFNGMGPGESEDAALHTVSLDAFAAGQPVTVRLEPVNPQHGRAIVREARRLKRASRNRWNHRYNFAFRNCEDFCRHCYRVGLDEVGLALDNLPPSQRRLSVVRLSRAASLGYMGAKVGRLAGPYGMAVGAVAGGVAGLVLNPRSPSRKADDEFDSLPGLPAPEA